MTPEDVLRLANAAPYRPDAQAARERGQWQLEYVARLLRVLQQEVEVMQRGIDEPSAEEMSDELAGR